MIEAYRNCLCCGVLFRGATAFCSLSCRTAYERARWGENGTHINRFGVVNRRQVPAVQRKHSTDNRS